MLNNNNKTLLIADDDEMFVKLITNEFAEKGVQVFSAGNGQEVIDKAAEIKPDIILMDMIMPIKDGFEAIQEIRMNQNLKNIKIIVFSNLGQTEDVEKAVKLGANGYLIKKDYSLKDLVDKVLVLCGN